MIAEKTAEEVSQLYTPFHESIFSNPYPFYEVARQSAPVFYSEEIDHWVVSRHQDVKQIFMDHESFSGRNALTPITPLSEEAQKVLDEGGVDLRPTLGNNDRPDHTRFRKNLMRVFTSRYILDHEPFIRDLVNSLVSNLIDKGEADLVSELIFQYPATVVLKMLGFSQEEMTTLVEGGKNRNLYIFGRPAGQTQVEMAEGISTLWNRCVDLIEVRKKQPEDDITSALLALRNDDGTDVFEVAEIANILFAFFTAGHETTSSSLANTIRQLLSRRSEWEKICRDPSLIPNAVEESLRHDGPTVGWRRYATRDAEVAGVTIPEGAQVLLLIGSANRDEKIFDTPDRYDITRKNSGEHFSFGKGMHSCFGNILARQELRVALEVLTARMPGLRLVESQDFECLPSVAFRQLCRLDVTW